MATRSFIGIENEDDVIEAVYCHWDGYLEHNGVILFNHYNTRGKVSLLINQGGLSILGEKLKLCKFYSEMGEQIETHKYTNRQSYVDDCLDGVDFIYLFTKENKWIFWNKRGKYSDLQTALEDIS